MSHLETLIPEEFAPTLTKWPKSPLTGTGVRTKDRFAAEHVWVALDNIGAATSSNLCGL
jgi:hypothetical protein